MKKGYFYRLYGEFPTRMWINNPSGEDCDKAIAAGAINCTTNPQYCQKLLSSDPEYIQGVIDNVLLNETIDHDAAAVRVYQIAAQRIMEKFHPLYEESKGKSGYVTMQDDPRKDEDTDAVIMAVHSNKKLAPNYMVKIPVIDGGMQAIERCVEENIPICATEVFSIAQTVDMCDMYEKTAKRSGNYPPFFVTHITGIFDDYVQRFTKRKGIKIAPEVLAQAGCAVARKEYRLLKEKGYHTTMLGGGARALYHFTEFVGGDVHVTINWKDADDLITQDGPIISRINAETPQPIIDELCDKLEVFRQAYLDDGLTREEYVGYGPVQLFRNAFLMGWYTLLAEVSKRRNALAL
jgi:transaldolase